MKKIITILSVIIILIASSDAYALEKSVYADVNGLVCDFCARALEKTFGKQAEVKNIDVNLDTKVITINFKDNQELSDEKISNLITDAGYNVVKIRHEKAS